MDGRINVRELRAEMARNAITQHELARLIGLSKSGLYKKISGENSFTLDEVRKIRDVLNLDNQSIQDIFLI